MYGPGFDHSDDGSASREAQIFRRPARDGRSEWKPTVDRHLHHHTMLNNATHMLKEWYRALIITLRTPLSTTCSETEHPSAVR